MTKFYKIFDYMCDELRGARKYVECAMKSKVDGDMYMYEMAIKLADTELNHATMWRDLAADMTQRHQADISNNEYLMDYIKEMQTYYMQKHSKIKYMIETAKK